MRQTFLCFTIIALACYVGAWRAEAGNTNGLDGDRTVGEAIQSTVQPLKKASLGGTAFLGIEVGTNSKGRLVISSVAGGSPAEQAGVRSEDFLLKLDGVKPRSGEDVRERVQQHSPGETVAIEVERRGSRREL